MDEWMGELDVCAPFSLSLSLSLSLFSRHGPPFLSFFPASARCVAVRLLMQRSAEGTEGEEDGSTREEAGKLWVGGGGGGGKCGDSHCVLLRTRALVLRGSIESRCFIIRLS